MQNSIKFWNGNGDIILTWKSPVFSEHLLNKINSPSGESQHSVIIIDDYKMILNVIQFNPTEVSYFVY